MLWLHIPTQLVKQKILKYLSNEKRREEDMYLSETYEKKWQPVLDHPELPEVKDSYKRAVTSGI